MIFKKIDDKSKQIQILKELFSKSKSEAQKKLIENDLKKMISGYEAEQENAYYLDFEFEKSQNILVLHDVRLEHDGRTAQFDHILISRIGIELLETKSSKGIMTINTDGSLTLKNTKYTNTYPNPLEQSKRHATVLREFIDDNELLSKRIGIFGGIEITSKILIHPKTNLTNKKLPDGFDRADSFATKRSKEIDDIGVFKAIKLASKAYNIDKAKEIAKLLTDAHVPVEFDYTKKYKIKKEEVLKENKTAAPTSEVIENKIEVENAPKMCPRCKEGKLIVKKVKSKKAKEKYDNDKFIGCNRYPKCRYTEGV